MKWYVTLLISLFLVSCEQEVLSIKKLEKTYSIPALMTSDTREIFAVTNASVLNIAPMISGEEMTFSVAPALPAGLSIDTDTGYITGTPTTTFEDQVYTITATNPAGSSNLDISLTALNGYIVNSNADTADANTGDSTCETATPGECTLRAAIDQLKVDGGRKMALLDNGTYTLSSSLLSDAAGTDMLVVGQGRNNTNITSANSSSVQILASAGDINFRNLTIDNFGDGATGPIRVIYATSQISFQNVDIENNYSSAGAIIQVNTGGNVDINEAYIYNNTADGRGVIYVENGTMVIDKTTWYQNTGDNGGCLESQNTSNTTIKNSTCFGNTTNITGKAAINIGTCGCATVASVSNTLIADNVHALAGQAAGLRLGRDTTNTFNITLANNILSNNTDGAAALSDCYIDDSGTLTDNGYNIVESTDCLGIGGRLSGPSNQLATDPMLTDSTPSDNGGNVPTISISTSSPAIDAGLNSSCDSYDQRGLSRPVDYLSGGAICDIGPLEIQL